VLAYLITMLEAGRRRILDIGKVPAAYLLCFVIFLVFGWISIRTESRRSTGGEQVTLALIQQNADPRKHEYTEVFEVLKEETNRAMAYGPDLVVWSETAFVPNIRRWSTMDPARYPYARLVREFLAYQKSLDVWLLTGNDDYEIVELEGGETERLEYNAAVFFDPAGNRVDTYRKIHLVPFTEYFPFKEEFPGFYEWLRDFDVFLWEPGTERVVFEHPLVKFSTPICFEDGFPGDVRAFVREGADLIVNISNDYWSLTEVEAQQHYANALFRAVENRKPMVRASASGVTCNLDSTGRLIGKLPFYESGFLIARVSVTEGGETLYTKLGDWFPLFCAGLLLCMYITATTKKIIAGRSRR
jgi:apolipoprotein N-acyltransferase